MNLFDEESSGDEASLRSRAGSQSHGAILKPNAESLRAPLTGFDDDKESSEDEDSPGAYERIKRQLMGDSNEPPMDEDWSVSNTLTPRHQVPATDRTPHVSPSRSARPSVARSPGLFVSPNKPEALPSDEPDPEEDLGMDESRSRLQELVARKRREREEKEKAAHRSSDIDDESMGEETQRISASPKDVHDGRSTNGDNGSPPPRKNRKERPTRKASKKAMDEMNRETQRISRNMQLSHQAKTRTKFTTADLFKKMGFRQPSTTTENASPAEYPPKGSSSPVKILSDGESIRQPGTPPSSPPSLGEERQKGDQYPLSEPKIDAATIMGDDDEAEELLSLDDLISQLPHKLSRTKNAIGHEQSDKPAKEQKPSLRRFLKSARRPMSSDVEEEDDLEIVRPQKPSRIAALDNVPAKRAFEPQSIQALRVLAHLNDQNHGLRAKGRLTASELKANLTRQAREQAQLEKMERIQALKDKGVYVETEDEKERNQMQIESMIERARREADELAKREKEAAKREGKEVVGDLPDSDGDEEFAPSEEEDNLQLSGSEDENDEDVEPSDDEDEEGDDEDGGKVIEDEDGQEGSALVDGINEEDSEEDDIEESDERFVDDSIQTPKPNPRWKKAIVLDEESDDDANPITPALQSMKTPGSKSSLAQAFGFAQEKSPAGGLSQFFGGTMGQSQSQAQEQRDSLDFLRGAGPAPLPEFGDVSDDDYEEPTQDYVVRDSQNGQQSPVKTSPAMWNTDTRSPQPFAPTQASPFPDATQDVGFQKHFSPAQRVGIPVQNNLLSAVDTVMLEESESPIVKRKGRLHRGRRSSDVEIESSDHEVGASIPNERLVEGPNHKENAFAVMEKASRKVGQRDAFDKENSKAKGMFEEQADESDDEYAGIGGVSDDDMGEEDEEDRKWKTDAEVKMNRGKAAEFHAEWERTRDERDTTKLYRDITTGALRRQHDNRGDLLDWDEEDEAHTRRRAARQRQEAKMRKALLTDEKLEKIAENPKQQAFFSAVADYAADDEVMFLDDDDDDDEGSQSQPIELDSASTKRKRENGEEGAEPAQAEQGGSMPPPKSRRTNRSNPRSALDIKRTLSSLLDEPEEHDEPDAIHDSQPHAVYGAYSAARLQSPSESDKENESDMEFEDEDVLPPPDATPPKARSPPRHHRTAPNDNKRAVIDRMALKRASSSTNNLANITSGARLAFQAIPTNNTSFKAPSLLRRATTNASIGSNEGNFAEKSGVAEITGANKQGVKMGGSKKSSVNWHVRETERKQKIERIEREREVERTRVGKMFSGGGGKNNRGLGGLGGGAFE